MTFSVAIKKYCWCWLFAESFDDIPQHRKRLIERPRVYNRVSPQVRTILHIPNPSPEIHKNSFHITWRWGRLPPRWRLPMLCSAPSQPGHCRNLRHRSGGSPSQQTALSSKLQSSYYLHDKSACGLWQYWRCHFPCWIKLCAFILSPRYENDPQRASTWLATQPRIIRFSLDI